MRRRRWRWHDEESSKYGSHVNFSQLVAAKGMKPLTFVTVNWIFHVSPNNLTKLQFMVYCIWVCVASFHAWQSFIMSFYLIERNAKAFKEFNRATEYVWNGRHTDNDNEDDNDDNNRSPHSIIYILDLVLSQTVLKRAIQLVQHTPSPYRIESNAIQRHIYDLLKWFYAWKETAFVDYILSTKMRRKRYILVLRRSKRPYSGARAK